MHTNVYRFILSRSIDPADAEATLYLAITACEGLFGHSRVRMDVSYHLDAPRAAVLIDGTTATGDAVVRIFTVFLARNFGPDSFSVRRLRSAPPGGVAA